jgi:hypothetical protein
MLARLLAVLANCIGLASLALTPALLLARLPVPVAVCSHLDCLTGRMLTIALGKGVSDLSGVRGWDRLSEENKV